MNPSLNCNTWVGDKITATNEVFVKMLDASATRSMLKICNQSHEHYLKLAFSKEDADNGIYIPMQPDGLMDQTSFIPTNEIWVAGEGADIVCCFWVDARDNIKF